MVLETYLIGDKKGGAVPCPDMGKSGTLEKPLI